MSEPAGSINHQDIEGLTGIRGLAATMVLVFHLFSFSGIRLLLIDIGDFQIPYQWLFTCGWMGANIFFVLSGFLLAIPFVRHLTGQGEPVEIVPYLQRRIRRVVPAYWLQIFILLALLYATSTLPDWKAVAMHLTFLQNFRVEYVSLLNGVYWTLPTELGFYLLLPAFAALAGFSPTRKISAWLLLSMTLITFAIGYRVVTYASVETAPIPTKAFTLLQLPGMLDQFAIGMALAWVYVRYTKSVSSLVSNVLLLAGLAGLATMMILIDHFKEIFWDAHILLFVGYTITAGFIGLLVLGTAFASPLSKILFANSLMLYLGLVSYSLYLWHLPILTWTMKLLDHFDVTGDRTGWLIVLVIPLSLLAATLSYYWVERPFMARKGRRKSHDHV
jgi:peptidoglycan/LPS O-acetylase OafA/YrhL